MRHDLQVILILYSNKPKMVNAPEGFNQDFSLKHLFNGKKWILLRACFEMSFNSMMYHDEIHVWLRCWPARQQQEQSGHIQNKSEKNGTNLLFWRNKADKFRINLKKAWWNDQKYEEIPKFRGISRCSGPMLPFSTKAKVFCHAFSKPCHIFPNPAIPRLFHHAFAAHFTTIRPMLSFFTKADMVNAPYDPLWQPFLVCFSTSISNHPRLYQRATKFFP